jgi:hypothetical protein
VGPVTKKLFDHVVERQGKRSNHPARTPGWPGAG